MLNKLLDIIYSKEDGIASITINRPERMNSLRNRTFLEIIEALLDAWGDKSVGVIVLTGAGDRAFCTGGDQGERGLGGYVEEDEKVISGITNLDILQSHSLVINLIKGIPKPIIAAVNGYAIGAGHAMHLACDLSIAADHARFGQTGAKVGSFDVGASALLARIVGPKKAREIWYLCRQYSAQEALELGMVNKVVPKEKLQEEVNTWCRELLSKSPTALGFLKVAFNADADGIAGVAAMSELAVDLYYEGEESMEGRNAFMEKRAPDFSKFRK